MVCRFRCDPNSSRRCVVCIRNMVIFWSVRRPMGTVLISFPASDRIKSSAKKRRKSCRCESASRRMICRTSHQRISGKNSSHPSVAKHHQAQGMQKSTLSLSAARACAVIEPNVELIPFIRRTRSDVKPVRKQKSQQNTQKKLSVTLCHDQKHVMSGTSNNNNVTLNTQLSARELFSIYSTPTS